MSASGGRFVWFDLLTTDTQGAKAFYTDIIGWRTIPEPGGAYTKWSAGDLEVGGVFTLPDDVRKAGVPPHWLGFVSVDDADAVARKAEGLGGTVRVPGAEIPSVGRYAVLSDPQGASFGVFQLSNPAPPPAPSTIGQFGWAELNTTDWKSAWAFYAELFGWKQTGAMDMGPELGEYCLFGVDEKNTMGGMANTAKVMKAPPSWLYYTRVANVNETAEHVSRKGGKVLNGPMDVPGDDRIAQCSDPQGAMFAIVSSTKPTG